MNQQRMMQQKSLVKGYRMKCCMISYSMSSDPRIYRYIQSLAKRGDSVDMICLGCKGEPRHEIRNYGHIYRLQTREHNERSPLAHLWRMICFMASSTFHCAKLQIKRRYDLIHFHNIPDFGIFCTFIAKWMGAKVILDIHDIVPEFYMRRFGVHGDHRIIRLLKWVEKLSARYADHVITVTDIWRERLVNRSVSDAKCSVILNAPYNELFDPGLFKKKRENNRFVLSYHGVLTEPTGVDIIIRALPYIVEKAPDIILHVIGDGRETDNIRKLATELGLKDHVIFLGSVSVDRIPQLISQSDIGLDPKRDGIYAGETLSVKALEYLAMGVPLIASRTKASAQYFDDRTVCFFNPGDPIDLANQLLNLYHDPDRRRRMIQNGFRLIREHRWNKYEKVYFNIIDSLIAKNE